MVPQTHVLALRLLLGVSFAALLMAELRAVPAMYDDWVRGSAEAAAQRWPLLVVALLVLACVQVVIVCVWRLLTLVAHDRIFTERAMTFVDAVLRAITTGEALLLGAFLYAVGPLGLGATPAVLLLLVLVVGAVTGLLVVVLRALLRQATMLRTDLDAVV
jgi:hypothetical protein